MPIEFTSVRTPEYFRRHVAARARRAVIWRLVGALGLALLCLVVIVFADDMDGFTAVIISGFFAGVIGMVLVRARHRYRDLLDTPPPFWYAPRNIRLDDEAIHVTTELSAVTYRWPLVQHVAVWPEAYLLQLELFGTFDVARAPLTAWQDAEIHAFLVARGLLPAPAEQASTAATQ